MKFLISFLVLGFSFSGFASSDCKDVFKSLVTSDRKPVEATGLENKELLYRARISIGNVRGLKGLEDAEFLYELAKEYQKTDDIIKAISLYEESAELGYLRAAKFLAQEYLYSKFIDIRDLDKAIHWSKRAVELGDTTAHLITQRALDIKATKKEQQERKEKERKSNEVQAKVVNTLYEKDPALLDEYARSEMRSEDRSERRRKDRRNSFF